jgi:hypothetical protein
MTDYTGSSLLKSLSEVIRENDTLLLGTVEIHLFSRRHVTLHIIM